jgi:YD repeat-containing protein
MADPPRLAGPRGGFGENLHALNPNGKIETVADNFGRRVDYAYDGNDNLIRAEYRDGASAKYGYGAGNLLTRVYNRRSQVFREVVYNQERKVIDPLGHVLKRQPSNIAGPRQFAWIEDRNGNRSSFSYNSAGEMTSRTDPLGKTESLSCASNHKVASHADASGIVTRSSDYGAFRDAAQRTQQIRLSREKP